MENEKITGPTANRSAVYAVVVGGTTFIGRDLIRTALGGICMHDPRTLLMRLTKQGDTLIAIENVVGLPDSITIPSPLAEYEIKDSALVKHYMESVTSLTIVH